MSEAGLCSFHFVASNWESICSTPLLSNGCNLHQYMHNTTLLPSANEEALSLLNIDECESPEGCMPQAPQTTPVIFEGGLADVKCCNEKKPVSMRIHFVGACSLLFRHLTA